MEQLLCESIRPGAVVFGRVTSFPWWPAVVGRCPSTGEWRDNKQRTWVFFFNDNTGAWLRIRDMRPFTKATQEAMTEINSTNTKFRKYLDRIDEACQLAQEYLEVPMITRPLCDYSANLTNAALELVHTSNFDSRRANHQNALSTVQEERQNTTTLAQLLHKNEAMAKLAAQEPTEPYVRSSDVSISDHTQTYEKDTEEDGENSGQRPRRKRKRSTRYLDIFDTFEPRAKHSKNRHDRGVTKNNLQYSGHKDHAVVLTRPEKEIVTKVYESPMRADQAKANTDIDTRFRSTGSERGAGNMAGRSAQNIQSHEQLISDHPNISRREWASPSSMADSSSTKTNGNVVESRLLRGRGSRAKDAAPPVYGFVSSANEYRVAHKRAPAVDDCQIIHGLQNRVKALEDQVQSLRQRPGLGGSANLGEDASAASIESAIGMLVRATGEFARSRGYDADRIHRGIDALWPKPPSAGSDVGGLKMNHDEQGFVNSLARSLVWTAWKKGRRS